MTCVDESAMLATWCCWFFSLSFIFLFFCYFFDIFVLFKLYYAYHLPFGGLLFLFLVVTVFILSIVMCDCHLMCSLLYDGGWLVPWVG